MVYNGPPPGAFVEWPEGLELPQTSRRYRVIEINRSFAVECKGMFFWYRISVTRYSTPEEVVSVIMRNENKNRCKIVAETPHGTIQSKGEVCRLCGR